MASNIKPGEEFLGQGLVGPVTESHTGDLQTASGAQLVVESWKALLATNARFESSRTFIAPERFMRDLTGCNLKSLKHENLDEDLLYLMESMIAETLSQQESRASITSIQSSISGEEARVRIEGRVVGTNEPVNLVVIRNASGKIVFRNT